MTILFRKPAMSHAEQQRHGGQSMHWQMHAMHLPDNFSRTLVCNFVEPTSRISHPQRLDVTRIPISHWDSLDSSD